jgi:MFS family permease
MSVTAGTVPVMSARGRYFILTAAFLGWMFSGVQMSLMSLATGSATREFAEQGHLDTGHYLAWRNLFRWQSTHGETPSPERAGGSDLAALLSRQTPKWFSLYGSIFLLGGATGGIVFGWVGDQLGRVKAMAASILCYSLFAGAGYLVVTPEQLLVLRFLSGMGVGGMWPTGVSLAAEAWSDVARPILSGLLGASANFGILLASGIAFVKPVEADSWRWIMLVGASPIVLSLLVLLLVPESPAWLAVRTSGKAGPSRDGVTELFRPPLLRLTLIGIALGTIPLLGGWGVTQWFIRWTEQVSEGQDPSAKALTAMVRSGGGALGSLFGGMLASLLGRRTTYFVISLLSMALSEGIYLFMHPNMVGFSTAVFLVGAISTVFFGWLPLYLPELFPTRVRATGSGISFNFGRILTAIGVIGTGELAAYFREDYRLAGGIMSLIYGAGMVVVLFAPDTSRARLDESSVTNTRR